MKLLRVLYSWSGDILDKESAIRTPAPHSGCSSKEAMQPYAEAILR